MDSNLKILIVDDSRIFRSIINKILDQQNNVEVVGSERNGVKAIEFINSNPVDLVTLDLEMPEMDGLQTLAEIEKINAEREDSENIGVIMLSSFTCKGAEITISALEHGAFDFITKPQYDNVEENIASLKRQLNVKLRNYATNRLAKKKVLTTQVKKIEEKVELKPETNVIKKDVLEKKEKRNGGFVKTRAVLIGVSTGGPKALMQMLPILSEKISLPIIVVQHMPPTFTQSLANSLNGKCRHTAIESRHYEVVQNDYIYIAPGGKHMKLKKDLKGNVLTVLSDDPPENGCRPSVDVLFRSAPDIFGKNIIAVVLTGMGSDGTKGLAPIKKIGAYIIAQDEKTSVVWGMPGSAVNAGLCDKVLPLNDIPEAIYNVIHNNS